MLQYKGRLIGDNRYQVDIFFGEGFVADLAAHKQQPGEGIADMNGADQGALKDLQDFHFIFIQILPGNLIEQNRFADRVEQLQQIAVQVKTDGCLVDSA